MKNEHDILGTGISYEYDEVTEGDKIITANGISLDLTNSSGGLQSLIPIFVHLDFLNKGIYIAEKSDTDKTYASRQMINEST